MCIPDDWPKAEGAPVRSPAVIFGLDGVLADASRLQPPEPLSVNSQARHNFQKQVMECTSVTPMIQLCRQLATNNDILIISDRPEYAHEVTRRWLSRQRFHCSMIFMRRDDDDRPAPEIKLEGIRRSMKDGWGPWLLVDSDLEVVNQCWQLGLSGLTF
jgi:hypothetical protein